MTPVAVSRPAKPICERIRVRGTVQGVGFRPFVWRIANELGIRGSVINDGQGVLIEAFGTAEPIDSLVRLLSEQAPPLARVETCERRPCELPDRLPSGFEIAASGSGRVTAAVAADAATCADCIAEIFEPGGRRYSYALTNCSHCGPRLSLVTGMPYDRALTTMAGWPMCADCRSEYENPADRRFHAQAIACPDCGPELHLRRLDGSPVTLGSETFRDDWGAAATLPARGLVLAIKGLGGYQPACDATQANAVARLRALKRRERKPFALMAADLDAVRACCEVDEADSRALSLPAAPIVLLNRRRGCAGPEDSGFHVAEQRAASSLAAAHQAADRVDRRQSER